MSTVELRPDTALDAEGVPAFRDEVARALTTPGTSDLVVDLSGVGFVDSSGLGALIRAREAAEAHGVTLRLARPRPQLVRLLAMTATYATFRWV